MNTRSGRLAAIAISAVVFATAISTSYAGPFIIAGTDADDHGFANASGNQDGWFFMQRALENLAPNVTNTNKVVAFLGSNVGAEAGIAAQSAFTLSTLPGLGWSSVFVEGAAAIDTFLAAGAPGAGILMMDSGGNVSGGATSAERQEFTDNATNINNFLGAGGGLFSQANGYGWVSALLPDLDVVSFSTTGLTLTPAGNAAFPGLTNADLSAGPWHNFFTDTGTLPILAVGPSSQAVILGAVGGTVTDPTPPGVPDSGSFIAVYLGLAGLFFAARRRMIG